MKISTIDCMIKKLSGLGGVILAGGVAIGVLLASISMTINFAIREGMPINGAPVVFSKLPQESKFFDSEGTFLESVGIESREVTTLSNIPKLLQKSTIAVEDRRFYTNVGIDLRGMLRALVSNIQAKAIVQGGSSITQQLVKNRLLQNKTGFRRKALEVIMAFRVESEYSKKEILEEYLNTIYFGNGAYGVVVAAKKYFNKSIAELTVADTALLVGLIAAPERANVYKFPDEAKTRRAIALSAMRRDNLITEAEQNLANASDIPVEPVAVEIVENPWVVEAQQRLLSDPLYSVLGDSIAERTKNIQTGGLIITLTKDAAIQAAADAAVSEVGTNKPGFVKALTAIDPKTGAVRAMITGYDFTTNKYNVATHYPGRQAGSAWKVINLAAAIEAGGSINDTVSGSSPCSFGPLGSTRNSGGSVGTLTLKEATIESVNCAHVRLELTTGFDKVIDTAYKLGITQRTLAPILSLTLGTIEVTTTEMASVAATLANEGVRFPVQFVETIKTKDGKVLFDYTQQPGTQTISANTASCVSDVLQEVINRGTGTKAQINRPAAGKTGTTDSTVDANFLGYTPDLAAFVWYGNPNYLEEGAGYGGDVPAQTWKTFMEKALSSVPITPFKEASPECTKK